MSPSPDSGKTSPVLSADEYTELRDRLATFGYGDEYQWCQNVKEPDTARDFFCEYAWVVINSGMKNQIAEGIWKRVYAALLDGQTVASAFGHPGKAAAIQAIWDEQQGYFDRYREADDKLAFLVALPWIGEITKWHLAKNFGVDCAKPDRHLVRLAEQFGETVDGLCARLAQATGDRIATVDLILWRAANLGWI